MKSRAFSPSLPPPATKHGGRSASGALRNLAVVTAGAAILAAAPIVTLILIALQGDLSTFRHVGTTVLPNALWNTALLLAGVAVTVSTIGVGTAWLVTAYSFPLRRTLAAALALPLAIPTYIVAYIYVELTEPLGPLQTGFRAISGFRSRADYWFPDLRSLPGAIFVLGIVLYPYVYMTVRALFAVQSATLLDAARTLGVRPLDMFRTVALPLARPALALGLSLALLETLNDIGASEYLGVQTLTVSIYTTWVNRGSLEGAAQIACVMLACVALILMLERRARGGRRYTASVKRPRVASPRRLKGAAAWCAFAACLAPVLFGFVLPLGFLVREAVIRTLRTGVPEDFYSQLWATMVLAGMAMIVVVLLGGCVAAATRLIRNWPTPLLSRVASLGYAVPGTVLAVGLLWPLAAVDNAIANAWRGLTGVSPGLILTGSGTAIVLAYIIRFLGIAAGGIENGYSRISIHMDDAARTLGRRPGAVLREIHLPLVRPALASAALLVFVDAMKELPATLLLRPLNLDTLATSVYAQASRGVFEDGALAALAIVVVGLIPVALMMRVGLSAAPEPPEAAAVEPPPTGLAAPT